MNCYCGSEKPYKYCCEPLHKGKRRAQSALELMKSRYSAYCTKRIKYLMTTTHPNFKTAGLEQNIYSWAKECVFYKLDVVEYEIHTVVFKAYYKRNGVDEIHHERSTFECVGKRWLYCSGEMVEIGHADT